jgi:PAS domain S-box-containing protein
VKKTGARDEQGFRELRSRAEKSLRKRPLDSRASPDKDVQKLIQELRVHQIELEMQNQELRNAQTELAESRDRYFDLYDFAPIGYFTLDEKGMILEVNLAAADLLGSDRAALVEKGFSRFVAPGSQDAFFSHRRRALETGTKQVCEIELKAQNDRSFHAEIQTVAVTEDGGNSTQLRTAVIDITERKRAELALGEAHRELERRIEERTADLMVANARLQKEIEERKGAEEALERSMGELHLLSSRLLTIQEDERKAIALDLHDTIAQSLSAVRMFLEAEISAMALSPPARVSLERIFGMLGDCIAELRKIIYHLRPSILDDLGIIIAIQRYCEEFQAANHEIRVNLRVTEKEKDIPETYKIVVFRILQEALNNVAKHSQARNVTVSLRKESGGVELAVKDDGAGFDVDDRGSQGLGNGIGLSSMKERVHLSGGSISIQSRKGGGTSIIASWKC